MRVLLLADTHIGCGGSLPARGEGRGPDFRANFERALAPARAGEVDLVVHGGDLLHRPRPSPRTLDMALGPLVDVAERGVPVLVVPGNHERAHIPCTLFAAAAGLRIVAAPERHVVRVRQMTIELLAIPYTRAVGTRFPELLAQAALGAPPQPADVRLLVLHQAVAGATVGPVDYRFRVGPEVLGPEQIPAGFAAVLSGHIHRRQVVHRAPDGAAYRAPVIYPGSTERTSGAERNEPKGMMTLDLVPSAGGGTVRAMRFHELPTSPWREPAWRRPRHGRSEPRATS